jgi:hypothetical protein
VTTGSGGLANPTFLVFSTPPARAFQVRHFSNLNVADSYVNITNDGSIGDAGGAGLPSSQNICVHVYTFDPAEELISCCSCLVTPNALNSLSAKNDLISNTLTPATPTSIVVKLIATLPTAGACNAATPGEPAGAIHAWGTTLHANTSSIPTSYGLTESEFSAALLSPMELSRITLFCAVSQANGSGFGICKSCRAGGLGADRQ